MSFAVWLVIFIYKGYGSNYCLSPPGNIFHLRFNSEMLVLCGKEKILREWYSLDTKRIDINYLGTLNSNERIVQMVPQSLYERRINLQGLVMNAVIVRDSTFLHVVGDELDGIFGRIFTELCATLNFTLKVVSKVDDYGVYDAEKDTWSGAIGEIRSGRADISISDFSMTSTRLNVVDFSFPLFISRNCLYFQEPHIFAVKWSTYVLAFSHSVWIAIFLILILSSILSIFLKIKIGTDHNLIYLGSESFLEVWGIFCEQGLKDFPKRTSLKVAYFFMFLLGTVLSAAYSASLTSILTSAINLLPFSSLETFIEDGTYKLAVFRGTADYDTFVNSDKPLIKKLMKMMIEKDKLPVTLLDAFNLICKNHKQTVLIYDKIKDDLTFDLPCDVVSVSVGGIESLSIILSKNNAFTDIINFHVDYVPLIANIGKLYGLKSVIFVYNEPTEELHESTYYEGRILRPLYVVLISNYEAIDEFSLATSTFEMSIAVWLVIFIYKGYGSDYCLSPPGNIFHVKFNTEMLVLCGTENIIREWYSLDGNQTEINDLATWNLNEKTVQIDPKSIYERRKNLQGLVMNAVVVKDSPFLKIQDGKFDGVFGRVLTELCTTLNFSFYVVSEVEEYGSWNQYENTWSGAIGEIYYGRADISISDFAMTSSRLNVVDFSFPFFLTRNCFFFRDPHIFAIKWSTYFSTFTYTVWIIIFLLLIASSILLIFLKIKIGTNHNLTHLGSDSFLEVWGIFCQQCLKDFPRRTSLKVAYFSIFLLGTVLSAAYSACLISFLASTTNTLPFTSLETFVEDGTYQYFVYRGSPDYGISVNSDKSLENKLMKLMWKKDKMPTSLLDTVKLICENPKLAVYIYEKVKEEITFNLPCDVISVDVKGLINLSIVLSKHNAFTGIINFNCLFVAFKERTVFLKNTLKEMTISMLLKIFVFLFPLSKIAGSYEQLSIDDEHVPMIIDICKLYTANSVIFLYGESIKEMEITTAMFKWTRALSREGFMTTNFYFSELHKSSYYVKRIVRPLYVAMISNYNAIDEFSLATSNFDMSFAAWLVIFIYNGHDPDYCHDPPFNIFHLRFDSKMIVRCNRENILREWYSIDKNLTEIDDIASWNLENGITMTVPSHLYDRRNNLKGTIMRVVTIKNSPFIKVQKNGRLGGIIGRIFEEICIILNISISVVSEVEHYGKWNRQKNTWSGAVEEIYSGRADFSPSCFSMSNSRLNVVDFTLPFFVSKNSLFIQEPHKFSFKWSSFFLTFSFSIWISIFGVIIVTSILLIFLKKNIGDVQKIGCLLSGNFLEIWGIFCQQGLSDFPENISLRIVYITIFLSAVVLSAAYSAALISFLTTTNVILPFRSLEEFVEDGSYQLYVFRGSNSYDMFSNSKEPLVQKIKKLIVKEDKLFINAVVGFNTLCKNQKIAFYTSESIKEHSTPLISCEIVSIQVGQIDSAGMILSKNNPYTDVINFQ
ncbi:hypothetical protein M0802_012817 [Mischocyttarus mexicanus]|nr:hypothetical protein M0802_012817 [Mischocyttarus mexicanus]